MKTEELKMDYVPVYPNTKGIFRNWSLHFYFARVIKPEEGKKLADSWGAAFIESSAKENEVMTDISN